MSLSRRTAIGSLAAGSALVLASCASAEPESTTTASEPAASGQVLLGSTTEVLVGSGTKFAVDSMLTVLITQPKAGVFKAFSATCTHAGCIVNGVEDNEIACGCHGARFDVETGMAIAGPAKTALGKIPVEIRGEEIWVTI